MRHIPWEPCNVEGPTPSAARTQSEGDGNGDAVRVFVVSLGNVFLFRVFCSWWCSFDASTAPKNKDT